AASTIATKPITRSSPSWFDEPATIIAPTITIPWIAFVPDISGVCSIVGTFEITSKPRKIARINTVSSATSVAVWLISAPAAAKPLPPLFGRLRRAYGSCRDFLPRHAGARHDPVVPVERDRPIGDDQLEQRGDVAREELTRVRRHRRRQVRQPDDRHTVALDLRARLGELAVAAGVRGEIDDHR